REAGWQGRTLVALKEIRIHSGAQKEELVFGNARRRERSRGASGRDKQQVGEVVFLEASLAFDEKTLEQLLRKACVLLMLGDFDFFTGFGFAFVSMPGGNLQHRGNPAGLGDAQRAGGI